MRTRRLLAATAFIAVLLIGPLAGAASAHVVVTAPGATQGGDGVLTFRVPTEKDVPTTKVEVALPTDTPITNVSVRPRTGWTEKVTTAVPVAPLKAENGQAVTEIVTRITWTATAGGIAPHQFDEFEVLADPLPKVKQLVFKVLQTYGDGSVVSWIQLPVAGAPEPDFPAPVLSLAADTTPAGAAVAADVSQVTPATTGGSTPTLLAGSALGVGVLALIGVGYLLVRGRRTSSP
ncbi:YcnI family protein [Nakamurella sp. PAMC28650]|uniref:YcnI family copper-binding membrane protein n=1 Tax=Nakamurella sp. PAMC28650 TaxID=2762325 RepID=UPI00164D4F9E|nr:YcnI family protein [Nakamurella sp. PAMC28650]QNK81697.1 YcnI family protein [Nakamurella sp. PAMC28650]